MMSLPRRRIVWHVFRTEVLNVMRDRVTLFFSVALPFLMWPLLAALMTQTVVGHFLRLEEAVSSVAVLGEPPEALRTYLQETEKLMLIQLDDAPAWELEPIDNTLTSKADAVTNPIEPKPSPLTSDVANTETASEITPPPADAKQREWAEHLIGEEKINALVISHPHIDSENGVTNYDAWIVYDSTDSSSTKAASRLKETLNNWQQQVVETRLEAQGLAHSYIKPLNITQKNLASKEKQSRSSLGPLLPYILVIMLLISSFHPAIEMTAGEKEHGTLPTLLSTPAHYLELVLGKYFAVVIIAVVSVAANMVSLTGVLMFGLGQADLNLSATLLSVIFLILLPLAFLFSAVAMAVAVFANSYREGQNLLSPLMIFGMLPAFTTLLPDLELTPSLALVPAFNASILIKQLLVEPVAPDLIALTILSNSLLAILALIFTTRVFASEPVIFGSGGLLNTLLSFRRSSYPYPNASLSLFLYVLLLVLAFYCSLGLTRFGLHIQVPIMQLTVFLGLPLLVSWYFHWPVARIFRLRKPNWRMVLAAVLIGNTAWLAFSWTSQLIPPPPEFTQKMLEMLSLTNDDYSMFTLIVIIAVLPGICEEFAFRGLILSGFLRSFSPVWAIVFTALCFGLAHMSLYRFIPTAVLGIMLGYVAWKTGSIWLPVLIHILNNANSVWVAHHFGGDAEMEQLTSVPVSIVLGAMIFCGAGLWLVYREPRAGEAIPTQVPS